MTFFRNLEEVIRHFGILNLDPKSGDPKLRDPRPRRDTPLRLLLGCNIARLLRTVLATRCTTSVAESRLRLGWLPDSFLARLRFRLLTMHTV